jgi:multiple sugar transport system substrate-binding protein
MQQAQHARSAPARRFRSPGVAAAALCLGAACAPDESASLELWATGREGEVVAQLIPGFEATHPGLRVRVQQLPFRSAHEKLLTAVVGDSAPDVAQLGNTWIPEFSMIGALEPLGDEVAGSSVIDERQYFQGVWDTNRAEGALYGVPWYVDTRIIFYRQDLLREAGFANPPSDWQNWLDMLVALDARFKERREVERTPIFLRLDEPEMLLALALQQPDPLLRDGDRFGNFESPGFLRALGFYARLFQTGLAPRTASTQVANLQDEFGRGTFVFYVSGPWQIGELERRLPPELADRWSTAPLPGRDGPGTSLAFGSSLVIFSGSKKKAAAWQLVEYLSQPDVQRRFYELTGDLPPRRDTWAGSKLEADPHTQAFRAQLERLSPTPPVPEWERIQSEIAIVSERAARGTMTVAEAAAELDARSDRILEKRRWMLERRASIAPEGSGR